MMTNSWQETSGTALELPPGPLQEAIQEAALPAMPRPGSAPARLGSPKQNVPQGTCQTAVVLDGFRIGEYTLRPHHYDKMMGLTLPAPGIMVIRGFTDNQGDHNSNIGLSGSRAFEVRQWLFFFTGGKPLAKDVRIQGLGQSNPVASNATEAGRSRNRRVEILLCQTQPPPVNVTRAIQAQLPNSIAGEATSQMEFGEMQSEDATTSKYYIRALRWNGTGWTKLEDLEFVDTASNAARAFDGMCGKYQANDRSNTLLQCFMLLPVSGTWVPCRNSVGFPGTFFCGRLENY